MSDAIRHSHGPQDRRRFKRSARTSCPGTSADIVLGEQQQNRFRLKGRKADIAGIGKTMVRITIDMRVRNRSEKFTLQSIA